MRSLILLGAVGLVAASPAPALINLSIVSAAPAPTATGPSGLDTSETGIYNAASASASAVAAVTGVATASASAAEKRSLEARNFCIFGFCFGGSSGSSSSSSSTSTSCTTSAKTTSTSTKCSSTSTSTSTKCTTTSTSSTSTSTSCKKTGTASSSTAAVTSSAVITSASSSSTGNSVPSTCTPVSWTNTFAFTSDTACPTPYEVGTYCGFINPEDPCALQPNGNGPKTTPDTAVAFLLNPVYALLSTVAAPPSGYASTFTNLNASVSANSYMGLYTLDSYNVSACAAHCDDTDLCTAFNVYIERDPMWNPDQCSCTGEDVSSVTNFKCTLWGSGVQSSAATNAGETRSGFEVVITGSNGYEKTNDTTPATPSGWTNPQSCSGVHDHTRTCIGEQLFKGVFDVSVCAAYADAQNALNTKHGLISTILSYFGYSSGKCNFFNAFMLTEDGVAQGTYCKLFAQQYASTVATSIPGWSGNHFYGVESSWSFCSSS